MVGGLTATDVSCSRSAARKRPPASHLAGLLRGLQLHLLDRRPAQITEGELDVRNVEVMPRLRRARPGRRLGRPQPARHRRRAERA